MCFQCDIDRKLETIAYHKSDGNSLKVFWPSGNGEIPCKGAFIILVFSCVFNLILTGNEHILSF